MKKQSVYRCNYSEPLLVRVLYFVIARKKVNLTLKNVYYLFQIKYT